MFLGFIVPPTGWVAEADVTGEAKETWLAFHLSAGLGYTEPSEFYLSIPEFVA